jgi:chaperonin cofactor prefoldin
MTEQNCRLQEQVQELRRQLSDQDSLLIAKNHFNDQLVKKTEKLEAKVERKEQQLHQAARELDELQAGI